MIEQAILIGLCAWRLSNLLIEESGPFGVFTRIRWLAGVREGPAEGFLPYLFSCPYCMTVWTGIVSYFLWEIEPLAVMIVAAMAIAIIADKLRSL